jgi:hypothetical protein
LSNEDRSMLEEIKRAACEPAIQRA